MNKDFVFPKLDWNYRYNGYSTAEIIEKYASSLDAISKHLPEAIASALPKITEIWQGILFFNLPFTFVKLIIAMLITDLIYPIISPYLHFRKKAK